MVCENDNLRRLIRTGAFDSGAFLALRSCHSHSPGSQRELLAKLLRTEVTPEACTSQARTLTHANPFLIHAEVDDTKSAMN